jgi:hypothetical protein
MVNGEKFKISHKRMQWAVIKRTNRSMMKYQQAANKGRIVKVTTEMIADEWIEIPSDSHQIRVNSALVLGLHQATFLRQ